MDLTSVRWRKASYSGGNGGNCVEAGLWRKASYSGTNGGDCVEVTATHDATVTPHKSGEDVLYLMRDSKDPDDPALASAPRMNGKRSSPGSRTASST